MVEKAFYILFFPQTGFFKLSLWGVTLHLILNGLHLVKTKSLRYLTTQDCISLSFFLSFHEHKCSLTRNKFTSTNKYASKIAVLVNFLCFFMFWWKPKNSLMGAKCI